MSKAEKALDRLQSKPKDFKWREATAILKRYGFELLNTAGSSHKKFYNQEKDILITICRPHPRDILHLYQLNEIIEVLKESGDIK